MSFQSENNEKMSRSLRCRCYERSGARYLISCTVRHDIEKTEEEAADGGENKNYSVLSAEQAIDLFDETAAELMEKGARVEIPCVNSRIRQIIWLNAPFNKPAVLYFRRKDDKFTYDVLLQFGRRGGHLKLLENVTFGDLLYSIVPEDIVPKEEMRIHPILLSAAAKGDFLTASRIRLEFKIETEEDVRILSPYSQRLRVLPRLCEDFNRSYYVFRDTIDFDLLSRSGYQHFRLHWCPNLIYSLNPYTKEMTTAGFSKKDSISFEEYLHLFDSHIEYSLFYTF